MTDGKVVPGSVLRRNKQLLREHLVLWLLSNTPTLLLLFSLWPAHCYLQKLPISLQLFIRFVSTCLNNILQLLSAGPGREKALPGCQESAFLLCHKICLGMEG